MAAPSRARKPTPWNRFVALPDEDRRELIDGELIETETPTELHEHIILAVASYFRIWVRTHGGAAYASGYKLRIDARHGFFPDAQLYRPSNRAQRATQGCVRGAPDIVLEVISEGSARYDKKAKLLGYARIGVSEYWIAQQESKELERLVLNRGKWVVKEVLTPGDTLKCTRFPGLEIPIAELYELNPPPQR